MTTERHVVLSRSAMTSLDEALAWAVQTVDKEFDGHDMLKLSVESIMSTGMDPDSGWEKSWTAAVSGSVPVEERS